MRSSTEFKTIMQSELKFWHFTISLILMMGLSFGVFVLNFILSWLYFSESTSSTSMFSEQVIFSIYTIDLILMVSILGRLYKQAKKRKRLEYCKSYFYVGVILGVLYLIVMPLSLETN